MGVNSLIYSFVARGTVVLAEYTAFSGNFSTIAVQCLQKLPANNNKFTYTCDRHTFNYLVEDGFTYLVVADEDFGRQIPFAFLERVKEDFKRRYGGGRADTAIAHSLDKEFGYEGKLDVAYSLDKEFGSKLKEHMTFCVEHPEEMNKLSKIKAQVSEVKGIMMDNIEKVLDRGEKIEVLVDKTDNLRTQADNFQRQGRQLRRKMWLQNFKVKLIVLAIIIVVILIIWLSICKGFKCK
uniref:Vesicle-associated membrane protein 72A.2 n=1 Tax=Marchantia polymorpha TaxID=3197 RepID=A0A0H5BKL3_MARPO|nr:vesicle-associated membrane protein 72A.2 [Marchantia polymorpha]